MKFLGHLRLAFLASALVSVSFAAPAPIAERMKAFVDNRTISGAPPTFRERLLRTSLIDYPRRTRFAMAQAEKPVRSGIDGQLERPEIVGK